MAGEQDIVSLGLNIDSFDSKKQEILRTYISLFNDLSKFDGKIFNPVMGEGLTALNTSINQTNKLLAEMNEKFNSIINMSNRAATSTQNQSKSQNDLNNSISNYNKTASQAAKTKETVSDLSEKESVTNKKLSGEYALLKRQLDQQAQAYANLYLTKGKDHAETKAMLVNYAATAKAVSGVDKSLVQAGGSASGATRQLGVMWSALLRVAYILPGLGIAGIFNLAFDAITEAAEALGIFNNNSLKQIEINTALNKNMSEQIKLYEELNRLRADFYNRYLAVGQYAGQADMFKTLQELKYFNQLSQSQGQSQDLLVNQAVDIAQKEYGQAFSSIYNADGGQVDLFQSKLFNLKKSVDDKLNIMASASAQAKYYSDIIAREGIDEYGNKPYSVKDAEKLKAYEESRAAKAKAEYERDNALLKNYFDAEARLNESKAQRDKYFDDQERKRIFEFTKDNISILMEKNKIILENERKFHDDKEKAIKDSYQRELQQNKAARDFVVTNISSSAKERQIAENKLIADNEKARLRFQKDLDKNDTEFYQRKILALAEIQKEELEKTAIANERIFLNEKRSLQERLDAYENYIIERQKIRDIEADLALKKGARGPGGENALTPEEEQRVEAHRNTQKFNIQADAEKRTYEIVHQYTEQRLKEVRQANDQEAVINKDAYAKELAANNERFKNKIFQYEAFKKNKEFIDKKYGVILTDEQLILDAEEDVKRLQDLYDELIQRKEKTDKELEEASKDLKTAGEYGVSTLTYEFDVNRLTGETQALNDAILKAQNELNDAIESNDDLRIKAAKKKYEELIQFEKEHLANRRAIQESLFDFASNFVNRNVDNELKAIDERTRAFNEAADAEIDAVERSSLSQKDKTALEIQLNQQKIESDKAAALEERKIKHDAAVKDRELAIAHVIWNGIEAVSAALKIPPPAGELLAIERGVLAAIQLANLLAVPIPSYKEGTKNHPGGLARYAEEYPELVKIPGQKPFVALEETISNLPKGTEVVPLRNDHPEFNNEKPDDSWEQTKYLARQIAKNKKEIKNIFKPTIVINMGFENRKNQILGR